MKNNNSKYYILLTFLFCSFITKGQEVTKSSMQKEYDAFISNEKANFTDFKDKRDKEFAQMLKNKWSNFDVQASSKPKSVPLPPKLPDVIPASPQQVDINKIPIVVIPNIIIKDIEPIVDSSNSKKINKYDNGCSINYFNTKIEFFFDQNLIQDVKDINEIAVSNYWEALSKSDYEDLIQQIKKVGAELSLNDWGYYTLVTKLSQQVNQKENEQTLFIGDSMSWNQQEMVHSTGNIGVWWGYPLGPNGKYSVRGVSVYESEREGKREGTSAD